MIDTQAIKIKPSRPPGADQSRVWRTDWTVPTSGALTQARQRLGVVVMRELFDRVAVPCALRSTEGAWLKQRRLMSLDGFDIEVFDSKENAERFGYAGKKKNVTIPWDRRDFDDGVDLYGG